MYLFDYDVFFYFSLVINFSTEILAPIFKCNTFTEITLYLIDATKEIIYLILR